LDEDDRAELIGKVVEIAAQPAAEAPAALFTSLCSDADGTIGSGYEHALKFAPEQDD
jgi:hypothetical protein